MNEEKSLSKIAINERLQKAGRQAAGTCLSTTKDDVAVVIYDTDREPIAAALVQAFEEIGAKVEAVDLDKIGERPYSTTPGVITRALAKATVSAMAVEALQGELSFRRTVVDITTKNKIRHAHMPSITVGVFEDSLSMNYGDVSRLVKKVIDQIGETTSLIMTSGSGTNIEYSYPSPPQIVGLDGLIRPGHWENLPSGQIIILPTDARGVFVVDSSLGDWFENKYDVTQYPVKMMFEGARVRNLRCDNKKLERELSLYLRSSENSGRISQLVIGANTGLTQEHHGSLFHAYRPGASLSLGGSNTPGLDVGWDATTFINIIGKHINLVAGEREILVDDTFTEELTTPKG